MNLDLIEGNKVKLQPIQEELPSDYANRLGEFYASNSTSGEKKVKGQFFTPLSIARYMSSLFEINKNEVSILDPGCGLGVLSICLVESIIERNSDLRTIHIEAYEIDSELIVFSQLTFDYLKVWLESRGVSMNYIIHVADFVLDKIEVTDESNLYSLSFNKYDFIISNPPYFKLSKDDKRAIVAKKVTNGHSNIYSIFMAISSSLLKSNGQMIFITPRSFSSGNYFQVFRNYFFNKIDIVQAHLFGSRKETFSRDNVLQETVILKCKPKKNNPKRDSVLITSSSGTSDLNNVDKIELPVELVIEYDSLDKILFLPTNQEERKIIELFRSWKGTLNQYNIQISTGRVVAYRSKDYIKENNNLKNTNLAPLYWLHNVSQMDLNWPIDKPGKGQYISIENKSMSILVENKNYLLLRRFSSKDDKSRLIATPYFCNDDFSHIGIENKLNYIYRPDGDLEEFEILGLGALLNSYVFDQFFRMLNGNVNVSATELRFIPLPPHKIIKEIGNELFLSNSFCNLDLINKIVNEKLKPELVS
ncbi:Eco57I restriction-modification methylase domain-containing protein [Aquimarina hainanensis]|uniref:site-specific DNA-methyltransferase (adenine-specific) n=1 Tax=Aquimarina hainanensis TaxID=1578017 RepID=A0ABW5N8Y7_9FLAO